MLMPTLLRASIEGGFLVAIIWALSRAVPRLPAATRTILWWCAAAKFLLALGWIAPIPLPLLPSPNVRADATVATPSVPDREADSQKSNGAIPGEGRAPIDRWQGAVAAVWIAGAIVALGFGVRRSMRTLAFVRESSSADAGVQEMAADLTRRLGLKRVPRVRVSDRADTPLVVGLLDPTILLPARFGSLTGRQQEMAVCHELAHVRRADLWLGCVPALAERIFFFHPLAHLAAREYAIWREAACDAAVIAALDAPAQEYGRLLLDLGVSSRRTGLAAAGASWSFTSLKRRLDMLRIPSSPSTAGRLIAAAVITVALAALLPLKLTTRPPALPVVEAAAVAELAPAVEQTTSRTKNDNRLNYVLFLDDHHTTMSGSSRDIDYAQQFKAQGTPVLWFRQNGREYIVRDAQWLQQIEALWRPVGAIGDDQGRLGEMQGKIGEQQGQIGEQQGGVGEKQGELGERQGELAARRAELAVKDRRSSSEATEHAAIEKESREIDALMQELNRQMKALDVKMRELDAPMRDLDGQMKVLDTQMKEAVARAESEMRTLLERAVDSGLATPVR